VGILTGQNSSLWALPLRYWRDSAGVLRSQLLVWHFANWTHCPQRECVDFFSAKKREQLGVTPELLLLCCFPAWWWRQSLLWNRRSSYNTVMVEATRIELVSENESKRLSSSVVTNLSYRLKLLPVTESALHYSVNFPVGDTDLSPWVANYLTLFQPRRRQAGRTATYLLSSD